MIWQSYDHNKENCFHHCYFSDNMFLAFNTTDVKKIWRYVIVLTNEQICFNETLSTQVSVTLRGVCRNRWYVGFWFWRMSSIISWPLRHLEFNFAWNIRTASRLNFWGARLKVGKMPNLGGTKRWLSQMWPDERNLLDQSGFEIVTRFIKYWQQD